jgi:DNA-binding FadR family transcriptional regulator
LIVAAGTPAELAEIERCLRGGDETDSYYEFGLWGTAIHRAMAQATHNRMLTRISQMLRW